MVLCKDRDWCGNRLAKTMQRDIAKGNVIYPIKKSHISVGLAPPPGLEPGTL